MRLLRANIIPVAWHYLILPDSLSCRLNSALFHQTAVQFFMCFFHRSDCYFGPFRFPRCLKQEPRTYAKHLYWCMMRHFSPISPSRQTKRNKKNRIMVEHSSDTHKKHFFFYCFAIDCFLYQFFVAVLWSCILLLKLLTLFPTLIACSGALHVSMNSEGTIYIAEKMDLYFVLLSLQFLFSVK